MTWNVFFSTVFSSLEVPYQLKTSAVMRLAQVRAHKLKLAIALIITVTALVLVYSFAVCSTQTKLRDFPARPTRSSAVSAPVGPSWSDDQGCASFVDVGLQNTNLAIAEREKERLHALAETRRAPERVIVVPKMHSSWLVGRNC